MTKPDPYQKLKVEFTSKANDFRSWLESAEALASAADAVRQLDDQSGGDKVLQEKAELTRLRGVYAMLAGYAIECAIKGLYAKSVGQIAQPDGTFHDIRGFKNHNYRVAAGSANLSLSDDELKALDWLSSYVTSWGRYPIPLKAKDLEIPEGFEISMKIYEDLSVEVHSSDQKNLKAAEALMTKLLDQLKT